MTDETTANDEDETNSDIVFCSECNRAVRLERRSAGLAIVCGCDALRSIKVATVLPDGWQA